MCRGTLKNEWEKRVSESILPFNSPFRNLMLASVRPKKISLREWPQGRNSEARK